jgi:hypothetical protein
MGMEMPPLYDEAFTCAYAAMSVFGVREWLKRKKVKLWKMEEAEEIIRHELSSIFNIKEFNRILELMTDYERITAENPPDRRRYLLARHACLSISGADGRTVHPLDMSMTVFYHLAPGFLFMTRLQKLMPGYLYGTFKEEMESLKRSLNPPLPRQLPRTGIEPIGEEVEQAPYEKTDLVCYVKSLQFTRGDGDDTWGRSVITRPVEPGTSYEEAASSSMSFKYADVEPFYLKYAAPRHQRLCFDFGAHVTYYFPDFSRLSLPEIVD